uniref:Putative cecropin n=1 Tax=Nyssomyia neivai TaxID=330878 RepID=A0A1L8E312_9DIPT
MNFTKYFVLFAILLVVFTTGTEAGFFKKLGKKLEKVGKNVVHSVEKALPAAQGVVTVITGAKAIGK